MWTVYILLSEKDRRTYVGSTNDISRRLHSHNNGLVESTKNRQPLKLLYSESFATEQEARQKEKWYKSGAGRRKMKEILNK